MLKSKHRKYLSPSGRMFCAIGGRMRRYMHIQERYQLIERLRVALQEQEFVLYYQPKVNMRSGALIGVEALIRWQHPQKGLLGPAQFLEVINDHPFSIDIGEWVIDTALTQIELWNKAEAGIKISVNIGARQLESEQFVTRLSDLLRAHPEVLPSQLEIEILETVELADISHVSTVIEACLALGVSFALDDFGTGYSSLSYLQQLPISLIKIDQHFINETMQNAQHIAILEGIISIAAAFRRTLIAEGVETIEHGVLLLQLGCELAQGYAIARPMPPEALLPWRATWKPDQRWSDPLPFYALDLPLRFARLEHRIWIDAAEAYLNNKRSDFEIENDHECRFGMWLDSKSAARYANDPYLQSIFMLHHQIHEQIMKMMQKHKEGEQDTVVAEMPILHELRDALLLKLEKLALMNEFKPTTS